MPIEPRVLQINRKLIKRFARLKSYCMNIDHRKAVCYEDPPDLLYHNGFRPRREEEIPLQRPRPPEEGGTVLRREGPQLGRRREPPIYFSTSKIKTAGHHHMNRLSQSIIWLTADSTTRSEPLDCKKCRCFSLSTLLSILMMFIGISELQVAREKNGVYLTEDNYVDIIKKDESQEKEITSLIEKIKFFEDESEKIKDMFTQTKLHLEETIKERDATLSTLECTRSVLAQTNIEKEEQEYLVARQAEIECKLSKQANILLAVSDESTKDLNGIHDKLDRLRDLEARNVEVSKDFHSSFVSKYNRIEESFESQIMEQSRFCAETRDTLNNLLYKRNGHQVQTSEEFTTAMDSIASLISDIEKSVSDNIYEEQAWVNSQMKHARNAADGQQKNLQQIKNQLCKKPLRKYTPLSILKINKGKKDYSELRKAFESFSEKIETHTSDAHKRVNENIKIRETINSEGEKMASGIEALTETSLKRSEALLYQVSQESSTTKQKQDHLLDSMNKGFDIILPAEQAISSESKEFVSKIQDDLEKKYSELESRLRGKSEKTADNLKYLNEKTQSVRSSTLDSQRLLEERLETHRSEDEKHTESLQQSINDHCKNTKAFGKLHSADMRESGRSVNHFVFQALSRDAPTSFTPIRKPPRSYPQKIIKGTPNQERLQRHRESRRGLSSVPTVDLDLVDLVEDDVDSVISANTMASEDMSGSSSSLKDSDGSRSQSISRQNSLENDLTHIKETKVIKIIYTPS
ncbi:KIF11 [Lepeophtheirus salmonis]|uniref:KIF11 n=1 Tax=Lepeophtheirus salmonis TaxID=72036 RepID=A0A7R8CNU1_LEPSM|nr:KIF11 [Lepeophtheirus salmonis]CAF2878725.1 KIF11 [Lepeophtheirus salmonis]